MMEFLNHYLGIGEFFNGNSFIFLMWKSFPVDEVMNCVPDMF